MSYLDWYLHLSERCRERGFDLSLLICPDPDAVVKKIIPKAVEIACRNARKQNRRDEPSKKHWKMYFTDSQLYQIGILEASQCYAKEAGYTPANWLIRYISFLSLCTLQRNSFYVAVGFERILNAGSARDILELYDWLSNRLSPDGSPIGRDDKSVNDICSSLHEQIYREFKDTFQTSGHRLMFDEVSKHKGELDHEIYRILEEMIPWETDHFSTTSQVYARGHQRIMAEMSLAHVCMDQQRCLENVKRDNEHISHSFDTWMVPIPSSAGPVEPPGSQALRWQDVEEEIMKEIHWTEEKSKRGWESMFEVVVDGEVRGSMRRGGSIEISLPPFARYMEIRGAESKAMVANCHLMDPHDIPETGWKSSIKVPESRRIDLEFFPNQQGNETMGLSLKIGIDARRAWFTPVRNWTGKALQLRDRGINGRTLAWAACAASLIIALTISLNIILNLRSQVSHLEQENADLRMQTSDPHAGGAFNAQIADAIEKIRKSQGQATDPPSLVSEALYDDSGLVALDTQGNLTGINSIPLRIQQMIKSAMMTGKVEAPDLPDLGVRKPNLMGNNDGNESFALIGPVGIVIETDRPTLRWEPLKGALSYSVGIADSDHNVVAVSKGLSERQWTIDRPLERGKVYSWQVIALKEGGEIKSPNAPGVLAKFQVLDRAMAEDLAQARRRHPNSHLAMGLLYARAGLLDEAEREFRVLFAANPKSPVAQKLMRNVQALRKAG